mgnify:CR=1 FL=1
MDRYISIPDAASCMRLVEECVEIGVAGENWEQHLASGMAQRVGGDQALEIGCHHADRVERRRLAEHSGARDQAVARLEAVDAAE